jgi:hypothetical protein
MQDRGPWKGKGGEQRVAGQGGMKCIENSDLRHSSFLHVCVCVCVCLCVYVCV